MMLEIREHGASGFALLSQHCSDRSRSLGFPAKIRTVRFISVKNVKGVLIGLALDLEMALSGVDILTMLILPATNSEYLSIHLCLF